MTTQLRTRVPQRASSQLAAGLLTACLVLAGLIAKQSYAFQAEPPKQYAASQQAAPKVGDESTAAALVESQNETDLGASAESPAAENAAGDPSLGNSRLVSRAAMLVGSLTVFLLAVFVGFEIITKVPPTLHTPLMSGSNAISGITIVGAMLTAGAATVGFGSFLGMLAVVLAMINVVGGFLVTHRMLLMFKKK